MSIPRAAIAALALLPLGCGAAAMGPPDIVVDRAVCSHCGMFVSEPVYAAASQVDGEAPRLFDDIGCLLDALRQAATPPAGIWVQDARGSGWIEGREAAFVTGSRVRTPMSGGVLAYRDVAAADAAAAAHGARVVRSLADLMAQRGDVP
jgi:nitrous oxide reductase accessory protein NosL